MAEHYFIPSEYHLSYGLTPRGLTIQPGDTVFTRLVDAHGYNEKGEKVADSPNPLNGPFIIQGVQPGNTLVVTIEQITPNRSSGWASQSLHPNLFDYDNTTYKKDYVVWDLNLERQSALPRIQLAPLYPIEIPLAPMVGCIGVAPGQSEHARSVDCGRYGGNMDFCAIKSGMTLYLPVFIDGAYLFLGDGHALQGAGEITGNGVEVSIDIKFSVDIVKTTGYTRLRGMDRDKIYSIENAKPLENAIRKATGGMVDWLVECYGYDPSTAGLLMGQAVDYKIGNLVSNAFTVACTLERRFLSGLVV